MEDIVREKIIALRYEAFARVLSSDVLNLFLEASSQLGKSIKEYFPDNIKDLPAALHKRIQRFLKKYNLTMRKTTNQSCTTREEQGKTAAKFLRNNLRLQQDWGIEPENR